MATEKNRNLDSAPPDAHTYLMIIWLRRHLAFQLIVVSSHEKENVCFKKPYTSNWKIIIKLLNLKTGLDGHIAQAHVVVDIERE